MKKINMITCNSCGARISKDTETDQCSLCGWPIGQDDHDMQQVVDEPGADASIQDTTEQSDSVKGPFCHMCGWENPAGARFCSSCGTKLQAVSSKPKASSSAKKKAVKAKLPPVDNVESLAEDQEKQPINAMHMSMMAVAGILIVAALYMITTFSRRAFPEVESAPQQAQATTTEAGSVTAAIPEDVASRIADLEAEAAGLQGDASLLKKREIVSILSSINRPDEAAAVQEEIAALSGTSDDWFLAGHFFYDWMDAAAGEQRFTVAQKAATAYEKGLEINPDDLNIRTALAMSYLNTRAPMQGVQQIRQVLETDPDHLQGNFYYGVMLMQINRRDQAKSQFERVKELVGPESPLYQQADMMLQNLSGLN